MLDELRGAFFVGRLVALSYNLPMPAVRAPWAVYVHLPWCRTRCPYCAFNIVVDRGWDKAAYTQALLQQWRAWRGAYEGAPETLFFGGGTPSLHPPEQIAALIAAIAPTGEVSLEANPGQVSAEGLAGWREAGVTRLSLGVQTFQARHARLLNRGHTVAQSRALLKRVAESGLRTWSVDLIFALPGQTLEELDADLDELLVCGAPHVSLYGLTPEEGTPLGRAVERGRIHLPDADAWRERFDHIAARLNAAGLERYEVSNFARPGHRCRHNELGWMGHPYLGLGAGAHGFLPDGRRTVGEPDVARFITAPLAWQEETPSAEQACIDRLLGGLRHLDGVPVQDLTRYGFDLDPRILRTLTEGELLAPDPQRVRLGPRGWALADAVVARLVEALIPQV